MSLFKNNPLIYRSWCGIRRPKVFWGILITFIAVLLLIYAYCSLVTGMDSYGSHDPESGFKVAAIFSTICLALEIFIGIYAAFGVMADSISSEKSKNTNEFLETLPQTPLQKVVGLCLGKNLAVIGIFLLLGVIGTIFGLASMDFVTLLWLQGMIVAGFLAAACVGLWLSSIMGFWKGAWLPVIVVFFIGMTPMATVGVRSFTSIPLWVISPYASYSASLAQGEYEAESTPEAMQVEVMGNEDWDGEEWADDEYDSEYSSSIDDYIGLPRVITDNNYHFFNMVAPWQVCIISFYLFIAIVSFIAAQRSLSRPSRPAGRRFGALIAVLVLHVLLIGFLADTFRTMTSGKGIFLSFYASIFFFFTLLWVMRTTKDMRETMEFLHGTKKQMFVRRWIEGDFIKSEALPVLSLVLMWTMTFVAMLFANNFYGLNIPLINFALPMFIIGLLFLLVYMCTFTLGVLLVKRNGKMLGVLMVVGLVLLPSIFSTALPSNDDDIGVMVVTPLLVFGECFDNANDSTSDATIFTPIFTYTFICGALMLLGAAVFLVTRLKTLNNRSPKVRNGEGFVVGNQQVPPVQ